MPSERSEYMNSTFSSCADSVDPGQPFLKFLMEPVNKIRFRYKSEQGYHGGLTGSTGSKKSYPMIKLENYYGKETVNIKVSLYTEDMEREHVLELKGKNCHNGVCSVKLGKDQVAKFPSLGIINKTKNEIINTLLSRKVKNLNASVRRKMEPELKKNAQDEAKHINMNSARLCFEAYHESNSDKLMCPRLFSEPIFNQKSILSGDLKIHRLSKSSGSCEGGEEIILLCDKVKKEDIQIHFYEKDDDNYIQWEDSGKFTKADVHYQYAITFKTPPFTKSVESKVYIELIRPSDNAHSEPREFTYYPSDYDVQGVTKKRKKLNPLSEIPDVPSRSPVTFRTEIPNSILSSSCNSSFSNSESRENFLSIESNSSSWAHSLFELNNVIDPVDTARDLSEVLNDLDLPCSENQPYTDLLPPSTDVLLDESLGPLLTDAFEFIYPDNQYDDIEPAKLVIDAKVTVAEMQGEVDQHVQGLPEFQMMCGKLSNPIELGLNSKVTVKEMCFGMSKLTLDNNDISSKRHQEERVTKEMTLDKNFSKVERLRNIIESVVLHGDLRPLLYLNQYLISMPNKEGNTLLHLAVLHQSENLKLIHKILEFTPKNGVNLQNKSKETVMHLAVYQNKYNVLKLLLDYEGNPFLRNHEGNNCFHISAKNNHAQCMRVLICKLKIDKDHYLDTLNFQGLSALHLAIMYNAKECVDLLLEANANVNIKEGKCGRTPLHFAVDLQSSVVSLLLTQPNIVVDAQDFGGNTPLHLACIKDSVDIVKLLMKAGANPNLKNAQQSTDECEVINGYSSIDFANGNIEIQKILELSLSEADVSRCVLSDSSLVNEVRSNQKDESEFLDSNHFKNQIAFLNENIVEKLCNHMDPPSCRWKMLATYLAMESKECERILELDPSPTKALIKFHERSCENSPLETFKCILDMAGLNGALEIIQEATEYKRT